METRKAKQPRLNNYSARLICNDWMIKNGHERLWSDLTYIECANRLRAVTAPKQVQVPFTAREDAVAYIRMMAEKFSASCKRHERRTDGIR